MAGWHEHANNSPKWYIERSMYHLIRAAFLIVGLGCSLRCNSNKPGKPTMQSWQHHVRSVGFPWAWGLVGLRVSCGTTENFNPGGILELQMSTRPISPTTSNFTRSLLNLTLSPPNKFCLSGMCPAICKNCPPFAVFWFPDTREQDWPRVSPLFQEQRSTRWHLHKAPLEDLQLFCLDEERLDFLSKSTKLRLTF